VNRPQGTSPSARGRVQTEISIAVAPAETQARAAGLSADAAVALPEAFEDGLSELGRHARTGVVHRHGQLACGVAQRAPDASAGRDELKAFLSSAMDRVSQALNGTDDHSTRLPLDRVRSTAIVRIRYRIGAALAGSATPESAYGGRGKSR
jgi:hypothetical protein